MCTASGSTALSSCAITPVEVDPFSIRSNVTPRSCSTLLTALSITCTFVFNVSSEKAVISPDAVIAPVTVIPALVVSNFKLPL